MKRSNAKKPSNTNSKTKSKVTTPKNQVKSGDKVPESDSIDDDLQKTSSDLEKIGENDANEDGKTLTTIEVVTDETKTLVNTETDEEETDVEDGDVVSPGGDEFGINALSASAIISDFRSIVTDNLKEHNLVPNPDHMSDNVLIRVLITTAVVDRHGKIVLGVGGLNLQNWLSNIHNLLLSNAG